MSSVIQVENLSKAYQIGEFSTGTLSQDIERWWLRRRGKEDKFLKLGEINDRTKKGVSNIVWSLKDLNFKIEQGDAVGIIGRNGAGKSTLLKILSRVTTPTTGSIKIKGRIASLLEVGTGFHPELSGRENIFLNGAILGMRKLEIKKKFDEMVVFSGVERYIDTPVKRYSSGMYVRLAFAVAAFLEPEILIVDEVLAVGDAEFQKKCMGKMNDVNKMDGRTIIFVSHNMAAMQKLCNSGMLMQHGQIVSIGTMKKVIDKYLVHGFSNISKKEFELDKTKIASVLNIELTDETGNVIYDVPVGKKWIIKVRYQISRPVENFISAIGIVNSLEVPINTSWQPALSLQPGVYCAEFMQSEVILATGNYRITVGLSIGLRTIQYIEGVIELNIVPIIEDTVEALMKYESTSGIILNQLSMKTYQLQHEQNKKLF